ncbi:glycosyltransferase family 62 protein [Cucurbitaria berberidis CBS 394.84]|uniref:Glycosyltransferase family 62 protein n=1 Tax=Cucurbitaria berberidis CBS 394.84 TaxID=1168544 RepID=A0A9P4GRB8_9PLEO|nr:glycosyltransferase family 62 protein [Cucurbitaria berberidis CBS 394.84]KAF1849879.1 glycosyltransferase family 62 protein [Cucurbitaria berberidis CBS 394.84]
MVPRSANRFPARREQGLLDATLPSIAPELFVCLLTMAERTTPHRIRRSTTNRPTVNAIIPSFCAPALNAPKLAITHVPSSPLHAQREVNHSNYVRARSSSVRISQSRGEGEEKEHAGGFRFNMLVGKGYSWKAAKARLPPPRHVIHTVRSARFLLPLALITAIILLWRSMGPAAGEMQRFYCWGPSKPPMLMTPNEMVEWHAHLNTPVVFNHHKPIEVNRSDIEHVNLNLIKSTPDAVRNQERVLILTPLRDASSYLATHFDLLSQLTYPHELIDLAFLVGDTTDETMAMLATELERVQTNPEVAFRSAMIVEKDFGVVLAQTVEERHRFEAQGPRRKAMARARNYLLATALKPEHSWVYWRDVDITDSPAKIIEDFVAHDRDVLVPNIWFHRYREENGKMVDIEGRFDYNSWQESPEGLKLAASLDKNIILAEGYKQFPTNRRYMALIGDYRASKDEEMPLDGIGGVNIIVKADVHRSGINFPCYAFENQAETEGFAKMAKRAGYGVYGLPNYVVWHIDTFEEPGNL